jgi:hypothetical protein
MDETTDCYDTVRSSDELTEHHDQQRGLDRGALLPLPSCVTCFAAMDAIGGGWWCDACQEFA